jgi:DNA helicase-2/ATP-dependent DNA helicase PcrA
MTRAQERLVLTGSARRRVFGEYQPSEASRFIDEVPAELVDHLASSLLTSSRDQLRSTKRRSEGFSHSRRSRQSQSGEETVDSTYVYEDEDQSLGAVGPGTQVRHPRFGVGTIVAVEPLRDDAKLTVRFITVGQKKLLAKYAKLTLA